MARIPLVDPNADDTDPAARDALIASVGAGSIPPNVFRAIANNPNVLQAVSHLASTVYFRNSLTAAERELAYLTASVTNDCHY